MFLKDIFVYLGVYLVYAVVTSLVTLAITTLAISLPLASVSPFAIPSNIGNLLAAFLVVAVVVAILDAIIGAIVSGMTTYYAVQRYRGSPTTTNMAFGEGVRRVLSIIGAQILIALAAMVLVFIPVFVLIAGAYLGDFVLVGVGLLLLLVLGFLALYLLVGWSLSTPAIMMEGRGAFASLSRSWELTRGHRLSIFAAGFVVLLLAAVVGAILEGIFGIAGTYSAAVGSLLATAVTGSWIVIMTSVVYQLIISEPRYGAYPAPPPTTAAPPAPPPP